MRLLGRFLGPLLLLFHARKTWSRYVQPPANVLEASVNHYRHFWCSLLVLDCSYDCSFACTCFHDGFRLLFSPVSSVMLRFGITQIMLSFYSPEPGRPQTSSHEFVFQARALSARARPSQQHGRRERLQSVLLLSAAGLTCSSRNISLIPAFLCFYELHSSCTKA
jgi:hypothetical protein